VGNGVFTSAEEVVGGVGTEVEVLVVVEVAFDAPIFCPLEQPANTRHDATSEIPASRRRRIIGEITSTYCFKPVEVTA
jgi:hypothetical protein